MEGVGSWDALEWTKIEPVSGSASHGMAEFLLEAEEVYVQGHGVVLVNTNEAGTLSVTNFRLLFVSEVSRDIIELGTIPLATIEKFGKHIVKLPSAPRQSDKTPSRRLLQVIGTGAVLARSSQPLVGLMMNLRSNADEKLVAALCTQTADGKEHRRKLYIADARPRKNALANGAMGGGSESSSNYFQSEVVFFGIDNIHAMRESLARLRDYVDTHGATSSDGMSSFLALVEKDWLAFGHPFSDRMGIPTISGNDNTPLELSRQASCGNISASPMRIPSGSGSLASSSSHAQNNCSPIFLQAIVIHAGSCFVSMEGEFCATAKETAEMKAKDLKMSVESLAAELQKEKQVSSSALAMARRANRESLAIKRAIQSLGCKIHFSSNGNHAADFGSTPLETREVLTGSFRGESDAGGQLDEKADFLVTISAIEDSMIPDHPINELGHYLYSHLEVANHHQAEVSKAIEEAHTEAQAKVKCLKEALEARSTEVECLPRALRREEQASSELKAALASEEAKRKKAEEEVGLEKEWVAESFKSSREMQDIKIAFAQESFLKGFEV
ncbi:hypothetical protein COCNU_scaffold005364G000010 [Cocos nucifera]|nr:hypothetical protein [Cocos nucifera]